MTISKFHNIKIQEIIDFHISNMTSIQTTTPEEFIKVLESKNIQFYDFQSVFIYAEFESCIKSIFIEIFMILNNMQLPVNKFNISLRIFLASKKIVDQSSANIKIQIMHAEFKDVVTNESKIFNFNDSGFFQNCGNMYYEKLVELFTYIGVDLSAQLDVKKSFKKNVDSLFGHRCTVVHGNKIAATNNVRFDFREKYTEIINVIIELLVDVNSLIKDYFDNEEYLSKS